MKKRVLPVLALCLLCLALCAVSSAEGNLSLLNDGVTWDTSIADVTAMEGASEIGSSVRGDLTGYGVESVTVCGYPADILCLFKGDRLAAVAYQFTDYDDTEEMFRNLREAVSQSAGEPNQTVPDRLLDIVALLGVPEDAVTQLVSGLWAGWLLEDDLTWILLAESDGLGILCCNGAVLSGETGPAETAAAPSAPQGTGTRGFNTPEACAAAVAQALIGGDPQAFLECYSIPETAREFDQTAYARRYGSFVPGNALMQPADAFDIAFNEARFTAWLLQQVWGSGLTVTNPEANSLWGRVLTTVDYPDEERLALMRTGSGLSMLTVRGTASPSEWNDRYAEFFAKQESLYDIYGMKNWQETVVLLDLQGRTVLMPLSLVQYDGGWLAAPFTPVISSILGIPAYSLLIPEDMLN